MPYLSKTRRIRHSAPLVAQLAQVIILVVVVVLWPCLAQGQSATAPLRPSQLASPASSFDLDHNRQPIVSLDGPWRFHPGDDPNWAEPQFDDSAWKTLNSNRPWTDQGYRGMSGYAWYRFKVTAPTGHAPLALEFGPIMTAYEVYIDGRRVGGVGRMPPTLFPTASWGYEMFPIPGANQSSASGPEEIQVALRVWHSPIWASYVGGGPSIGGHLFGDAALLKAEDRHHDARRRLLFVDLFAYSVTALIISITIFGLFLFRPKEPEYLWFAILLFVKSLDAGLNVTKEIYGLPAIPVFDLLDGFFLACGQAALMLFLCMVLKLRRGKVWRSLIVMLAISPLLGVLYWPGWLSVPVAALLQVLFLLPSSIWMLVTLTVFAIRRNLTARLLLLPVAVAQGLNVVDNINVALNQFGLVADARILETPFITAPYTVHPSVLAEWLFLLAMLAFLIRRFTIAHLREERYAGELEAARHVQQVLLPEAIAQVQGFAVDCVYSPADVVGGDFFQILPAADNGLLVVVGDVAGKGLPAAMMVSVLVGAIRTEVSHTFDPRIILASLNERMFGRSQGFTTCLCLHLSAEGEVTVVTAGHLAPYHNGVELNLPGSLPLGIVSHAHYERTTFTLAPGDRLTIVSDGVLEAQNRNGELLGFDRTKELSRLSAVEIAQAANEFGQVDDITVVTIAFHGSASSLLSDAMQEPVAFS